MARSVNGMQLQGRGRATRFRWLGAPEGAVFRFTDGNGCGVSDVMVELVNRADTLVQMLDTGPVRSSQNLLRNIFVPDAADRLGTFWRIGGGEDQKNDVMQGENLDVSGCEVGLLVEGRNSLNHELFGCVFKGRVAGQTGIRTWNGGSVRLFGGAVNQFAQAAFDIDTRSGVALAAYGTHVESCARLITAPPPPGGRPAEIASHVVVLDGIRWGSPSGEVAPHGEIIAYSGGPSSFGTVGSGPVRPRRPFTSSGMTRTNRTGTSSSRTVGSERPTQLGTARTPAEVGGRQPAVRGHEHRTTTDAWASGALP